MSRLLKLTVLFVLFSLAAYSRANDHVMAYSTPNYGTGALFFPQQGLRSKDCQYHLVMLDDYSYIKYDHGWQNRREVAHSQLPTSFCGIRDVSGLELNSETGKFLEFNGPIDDGQYCFGSWASDPEVNGVILVLQLNGNLCKYSRDGSLLWCEDEHYWGEEQGQSDCRPYADHPLANSYTYYTWGVDYAGNDVSAFTARGYRECGKFCAEDYAIGKCNHWTYVGDERIGVCWLKVGNPNIVLHAGDRQYVSGEIVKG